MKKFYILLFLIFVVGFFLRFYKLGEIPFGFHRDEAFLAYNAYSILKTGIDMSGNLFPLHLQSFLYSPAGYSYFSIPFIFLFGLNEFSARFASVFFGSLTILITYFLVAELFFQRKDKNLLALISSLFLAVSPWNIILSRTSTDNVIVVFFISLAVYLFLLSLRLKKIIFLILSFLSFFITIYIYQAPRSFLPFFIPLMLFIYFFKNTIDKKLFLSVFLFLALIILPIVTILISPKLTVRFRTLSVLYSDETRAKNSQYYINDGVSKVRFVETRLFHNKITGYTDQILNNYFNHFSYNFLFTDSYFPDRYKIPSSGLMYLFDLPLLIFGIWEIIKNREKSGLFLLGWVALAPIGSALTFDDIPNMQRTLMFFPALSIISAIGFYNFYKFIKQKKIFISVFLLISTFGVISFLHQYFVHVQYYRPWYRQDGYKELVSKVNKLLPNYKYAVITNRETAPSIFFLFYNKYDPKLFQKETRNKNKEQTDSLSFGKYIFSNHECPLRVELGKFGNPKLFGEKEVLYVNSGFCEDQKELNYLDTVKRKEGSTAFKIVDYNGGENNK